MAIFLVKRVPKPAKRHPKPQVQDKVELSDTTIDKLASAIARKLAELMQHIPQQQPCTPPQTQTETKEHPAYVEMEKAYGGSEIECEAAVHPSEEIEEAPNLHEKVKLKSKLSGK